MSHLSPLNHFTMLARRYQLEYVSRETDRRKTRIEEVTMYVCPVCDDRHDWKEDAEECCEDKTSEDGTVETNCPVCGEKNLSHRDAADCCLWKDIDAPTRWKIADAVENGAGWDEAIKDHA